MNDTSLHKVLAILPPEKVEALYQALDNAGEILYGAWDELDQPDLLLIEDLEGARDAVGEWQAWHRRQAANADMRGDELPF